MKFYYFIIYLNKKHKIVNNNVKIIGEASISCLRTSDVLVHPLHLDQLKKHIQYTFSNQNKPKTNLILHLLKMDYKNDNTLC